MRRIDSHAMSPTDERRVALLLRFISITFPIAAAAIACIAVTGQRLSLPFLSLPFIGRTPVALNGMSILTAAALIFLTCAQLGAGYPSRSVLKTGACSALLLSIVALASYLASGRDAVSPALAYFLFDVTPLSQNRCSIATAICVALLSLSSLCRLTNRAAACDALSGVAILISGAVLVAALFGVTDVHTIFIYSTMAMPTALAVWFLGVANVTTDPSKGWAALLVSARPSGRTTRQQILLSHVPIILVGVALHAIREGRISPEAALTFLAVIVTAPSVLLVFKSAKVNENRDKTNDAIERFRQETASGVQTRLLEQATALRKESEERRKVESAMYRAQRLDAIGQLTGGIAHDFNNLLMAVTTTLTLVIKQLLPGHPTRLLVERAIATTDRGTHLTKKLLVFSKTQMIDVRPTHLDAIIHRARDLMGSALGPNIQVLMDLRTEDVWVKTDPDQLQLAILNLALNARDAMPEGGELHLSTTAVASQIVNGQSNQLVRVRMKDTGLGMTPEVAARAGEPFFTTKPQGEGTGLGLAQVYGVMKQSGGDLRIESEPGRGTTIDLSLIRTAPELPKDSAKRPLLQPTLATNKSALILLIDDDDEVRIAIAELFRCEGHEVVEASNGQAGLDILVSTRPSVAVIDYLMPGLNGVQVALMAREQMPDLPIVFVSGYSDTAALEGVSGAKVLRKPVNADELLAEVAEYAIF